MRKASGDKWFVYMVRCADGTLYTVIAKEVARRCQQHNAGTASRYTRSRLPVEFVYQESLLNRSLALKREGAIKALSRLEKLALIQLAGTNGPNNHERPGCTSPFRENRAKPIVEAALHRFVFKPEWRS